jgi:hypothetical protein
MKILFLDIDGVVNCEKTMQRHRGAIGIDPYMAFLVGNMVQELDLKVVLSSSWRHWDEGVEEINNQVIPIFDKTGREPYIKEEEEAVPKIYTQRGREIKKWLDAHPEVEKYAILDDDTDMLPEQLPNFFKTSWKTGVTPEIIEKVKNHFSEPS